VRGGTKDDMGRSRRPIKVRPAAVESVVVVMRCHGAAKRVYVRIDARTGVAWGRVARPMARAFGFTHGAPPHLLSLSPFVNNPTQPQAISNFRDSQVTELEPSWIPVSSYNYTSTGAESWTSRRTLTTAKRGPGGVRRSEVYLLTLDAHVPACPLRA